MTQFSPMKFTPASLRSASISQTIIHFSQREIVEFSEERERVHTIRLADLIISMPTGVFVQLARHGRNGLIVYFADNELLRLDPRAEASLTASRHAGYQTAIVYGFKQAVPYIENYIHRTREEIERDSRL